MPGPRNDWIARLCAGQSLPESYGLTVVDYLRTLAGKVVDLHQELSRPVIVGLNGGQGSGKSTLSLFLVEWLKREHGLTATWFSLDDLYNSKSKRQELAHSVHPLFATRGVPGTHDVPLGLQVLDELSGLRGSASVKMPKFDKATDDQFAETEWPLVETPVDVVVFEGWCVGARPQEDKALHVPVNVLERDEDPDGRWRTAVNEHLKTDYADLFDRLDMLVMLRIPSFEKTVEWRRLQESKLRHEFDEAQLMRFMMYFERLTRHMLESCPGYADVVIDIDDRHQLSRLVST